MWSVLDWEAEDLFVFQHRPINICKNRKCDNHNHTLITFSVHFNSLYFYRAKPQQTQGKSQGTLNCKVKTLQNYKEDPTNPRWPALGNSRDERLPFYLSKPQSSHSAKCSCLVQISWTFCRVPQYWAYLHLNLKPQGTQDDTVLCQ